MSRTAAGAATPKREPYHFHFPDGNASIARLLVRALVPEAVPGHTVEDIVTTRINYARLDRPGATVRIRLGSLAVRARQVGDPDHHARLWCTTRERDGCMLSVDAVHPGLLEHDHPVSVPGAARAAERGAGVRREGTPRLYQRRTPNWTAFHQLGVRTIAAPGCFHHTVSLHEPINIGTYRYARTPEAPVLLRLAHPASLASRRASSIDSAVWSY